MKVLYATSEAYPFAMSGGLADVAGALPKTERRRFIGCRVVLPLYEAIPEELRREMKFITAITVPVAWRRQYCGIFEARQNGVVYYFIDNQYYFKRSGLYGHYDDAERFTFFSRAVLEILPYIDFMPDIIHCNDWQTAMVPVFLELMYRLDEKYKNIKTVFTIHNIQYQGKYGKELLQDVLGIPEAQAHYLEWDGCVNMMKGAIECSNCITTVSPTYAEELMDPWYAHGLDPILRERQWKLHGIVNGIDTEVYNPETDPLIYAHYSAGDLSGKAKNKAALQTELGLPQSPETPIIGIVSRLVAHKGFDLVQRVFESMLAGDVQFVILGSGELAYESFFHQMQNHYPQKVALRLGFIPELAHKIYAGADIFLMPSKSEPCGLAQMVALRYGTIPIVRQTGGLKDTVTDSGAGEGNGFTFASYNAHDMDHAVWRALEGYRDKAGWEMLVRRAMACDNSWNKSANEYIRLYKELLGK